MSERKVGSIKWYSNQKHFGFIISHDENREFFFHIDECDFEPLEGMEIAFTLGQDGKGRTKATQVKRVGVCEDEPDTN